MTGIQVIYTSCIYNSQQSAVSNGRFALTITVAYTSLMCHLIFSQIQIFFSSVAYASFLLCFIFRQRLRHPPPLHIHIRTRHDTCCSLFRKCISFTTVALLFAFPAFLIAFILFCCACNSLNCLAYFLLIFIRMTSISAAVTPGIFSASSRFSGLIL